MFSIQPSQFFYKTSGILQKGKEDYFLCLQGLHRRASALSLPLSHQFSINLTNPYKRQPVNSASAAAVPSRCQLTSGTESCKGFCHIADSKFLLVYDQFLL